ncbi:hypothetical protein YC2023_010177 [Brassica napus]
MGPYGLRVRNQNPTNMMFTDNWIRFEFCSLCGSQTYTLPNEACYNLANWYQDAIFSRPTLKEFRLLKIMVQPGIKQHSPVGDFKKLIRAKYETLTRVWPNQSWFLQKHFMRSCQHASYPLLIKAVK